MIGLKIPTPAMAQAIWQSTPNPSSRRIAQKFRQAGQSVSHETINRWRTNRWRSLDCEQQHPFEIARECLDDALPLLTGDPMTTATSFVRASVEREALEQLSNAELLQRAARELTIALCLAAKAMLMRPTLAVTRPGEVGVLMRALAQCVQAATPMLAKP